MLKNNKYSRWYFSIIEYRKNNTVVGYSEKHHIIPKCLGGGDNSENIVRLSAREHFICHLLLVKMSDDNKLKYALLAMSLINNNQQRYRIKSRAYEFIKKCNSIATGDRFRGSTNGLGKILSVEHKKAISKSNKGKNVGKIYYFNPTSGDVISLKNGESVPDGFIRGNPKANSSHVTEFKGSKYFHDPLSGEEKRTKECPDGWICGRSMKYVTNGISNKLINYIRDEIPDGWKYGRTMEWSKNERKTRKK